MRDLEPAAPRPPRVRRRATSPGTGPHVEEPAGRAGDDSDVGWGERTPAEDDHHYLADRPPHWGSD